MVPESYVYPEALIEGFQRLLNLGYTNTSVQCVRVKAYHHDEVTVPVLVANRPENFEKKDASCTYMFFGDQAGNDEGGMAGYILRDVVLDKNNPVIEIPYQKGHQPQYLHWDWKKKKWPPLDPGTKLKTTEPNLEKRMEWTEEGWASKKWGVEGEILTHHDSHGLCYDVKHSDGTVGCYDPSEFAVL